MPDTSALVAHIRAMAEGGTAPAPVAAAAARLRWRPPLRRWRPRPPCPAARAVELRVGPLEHPEQADNLAELFKEITNLGTIEPLDAGHAADGIRRFRIVTTTSDNDLLDLFTFHVAREVMQLLPMGPGYGFHEGAPGAPKADQAEEQGYGFFDDAPGAPASPAGSAAAPPRPPPHGRAGAGRRPKAAPRPRPRAAAWTPPRCASRSRRSTS
jgi:two-component system chemotaxis sensor kinase CheA